MRYWRTVICLLAVATALASCGELFELDEQTQAALGLQLERRSVDLMVGDTYELKAAVVPDSVKDIPIYRESANPQVVRIQGDSLVAVSPGETVVRYVLLVGQVTDSCRVRVIPRWEVDPYQYRYDMVVYAHVTVGGQQVGGNTPVAVFATDEDTGQEQVCSVGCLQRAGDRQYMVLRIYSNDEFTDDDNLTLRCYDFERRQLLESKQKFTFNSNTTIGTLSELQDIVFE